jgi:MFS family permease
MQQGLKKNWRQFSLLLLINALVGGMLGMERAIIPELAKVRYQVEDQTWLLAFIVSFGLTKAAVNYITGKLTHRFTRKSLLVFGWVAGLPVPLLLIYGESWNAIIAANIFLGLNQGVAWSVTVLMKIDLVGARNRGFAIGLNEFSGYFAMSLGAFAAAWIATGYGIHPHPFYLGIGLVAAGLLSSIFWLNDTTELSKAEEVNQPQQKAPSRVIFFRTTFTQPNLSSATYAGFINNLNDALAWGVLPVWMSTQAFTLTEIGFVAGLYPAVWGIGQIFAGRLGDTASKRYLLTAGMLLQAAAIGCLPVSTSLPVLTLAVFILGMGKALVYPTLLAAVADNTSVANRPESLGVFRFWRDFGYVAGGITIGASADWLGITYSMYWVALATISAAAVVFFRMRDITPFSQPPPTMVTKVTD